MHPGVSTTCMTVTYSDAALKYLVIALKACLDEFEPSTASSTRQLLSPVCSRATRIVPVPYSTTRLATGPIPTI